VTVEVAVVWYVTVKVAVFWDMTTQSMGVVGSRWNAGNPLPNYSAPYSWRQYSWKSV